MKKRRTRVLVYAPEKATAEVITRGLTAIDRLRLEIDVALDPELAGRQLVDCAYDVLLVGQEPGGAEGAGEISGVLASASDTVPVVVVGGVPGEVKSNGVHRVPLPLSYTLLRRTLLRALGLRAPREARTDRQAG